MSDASSPPHRDPAPHRPRPPPPTCSAPTVLRAVALSATFSSILSPSAGAWSHTANVPRRIIACTHRSARAFERDVAHEVLEQPHGREVLGRAPRDQPGAVPLPPEQERQRFEAELGQPRGTGTVAMRARGPRLGGTCPRRPRERPVPGLAGALTQPFEHRADALRRVAVEPRASHEVYGSRARRLKRVVMARDDDVGGNLEQRLAAQMRCQRLAVVDAAAVQVALAALEKPSIRESVSHHEPSELFW